MFSVIKNNLPQLSTINRSFLPSTTPFERKQILLVPWHNLKAKQCIASISLHYKTKFSTHLNQLTLSLYTFKFKYKIYVNHRNLSSSIIHYGRKLSSVSYLCDQIFQPGQLSANTPHSG